MKSKMHIVFTTLTVSIIMVLLYVPTAYSADATYQVGGKTITCRVSDIKTYAGVWTEFNLRYDFCTSGNNVTLKCTTYQKVAVNADVGCYAVGSEDQFTQACDGVTFKFNYDNSKKFLLNWGTIGAQKYVCDEQFKLMNVTVVPLK